jgi:hypothetical protein
VAITTGDGYIASAKQIIPYTKTAAVTTIALNRFSIAQAAGNPGALTLAGTGAPGGALFTDATAGFPTLVAFGGSATGYLTRVTAANTVIGRIELWDKIYGYNIPTGASGFGTLATLTLSSQPSILGRCPDGAGHGLRLFLEITTQMSASATTVNVTYTNSAGTTGKSTGATASLSGFTAGRWVELPLASGDSGVQKIETVVIGGATNAAGVANVIIARPLWSGSIRVANAAGVITDGLDRTGMPIVYDTSAIVATTVADSTSSGVPDLNIEIANG